MICQGVPLSHSLGEEIGLVNDISSQWGLKSQGVRIPGMHVWGARSYLGNQVSWTPVLLIEMPGTKSEQIADMSVNQGPVFKTNDVVS